MFDLTSESARPGTLRSLIGTIVALLLTRAELIALETQEQKDNFLHCLLTGGLALVFLLVGLLALATLLTLLVPVQLRLIVLGALASIMLLVGVILVLKLRCSLRRQPPPFVSSLAEFRKDWEALGQRK